MTILSHNPFMNRLRRSQLGIQTHPIREVSQLTPRPLNFSLEGTFCDRELVPSPFKFARRRGSGAALKIK